MRSSSIYLLEISNESNRKNEGKERCGCRSVGFTHVDLKGLLMASVLSMK